MLYSETLSNGIKVVGQKLPHFRSISVGVWVRTGSMNETPENNGVSHFIEHMLFKGTSKRSAKQIAVEMDGIGGQLNAFTSKECTCYYANVMDRHLDEALDMLCDLVMNSALDEAEIEKEKGVVAEEISMVEDSPEDLAHDLLATAFFAGDKLGMTILGPEDNIKSLSRGQLMEYLNSRYTSDNMIISIAGNMDEASITNQIGRYFAGIEGGGENVGNLPMFKPAGRHNVLKQKETEQVNICLALPGYDYGNKMLYPLMVLNNIFGGGMSSRLFQKIREEMGAAYSVYSYPSAYSRAGMFTIYAGTKPQNAIEVVNVLIDEVEKIRDRGIDEAEFKRAKDQLKGNYILGSESANSRMMACGKSMSLIGRIQSIEEVLGLIEAVTIEDVQSIIPEMFDISKMSSAIVGTVDQKQLESALRF